VYVAQQACRAVLCLACGTGDDVRADQLVSFGVAEVVALALRTFAGDEDLVEYGCWAIRNLASGGGHEDARATRLIHAGIGQVRPRQSSCPPFFYCRVVSIRPAFRPLFPTPSPPPPPPFHPHPLRVPGARECVENLPRQRRHRRASVRSHQEPRSGLRRAPGPIDLCRRVRRRGTCATSPTFLFLSLCLFLIAARPPPLW
jgi:hypothetical protein